MCLSGQLPLSNTNSHVLAYSLGMGRKKKKKRASKPSLSKYPYVSIFGDILMSYCKLTHDFNSHEVCCAGVIRQAKDRSGKPSPSGPSVLLGFRWDAGTRVVVGLPRHDSLIPAHLMPRASDKADVGIQTCSVDSLPKKWEVYLHGGVGVWNRLSGVFGAPHWQQGWQKSSSVDICIGGG